MVVRSNFSGVTIKLKDIAIIEDGANDPTVLANFNGKPAVFLIVNKKAGADTIALVKEVNEILDRFKRQLDEGFSIHVYSNEALKVKRN